MSRLDRLRLSNLRIYATADLSPSEGVNMLVGANAQGKTTLLEAIHLASTGRHLRARRDSEMVRMGEQSARIIVDVSDPSCEIELTLSSGRRKRIGVNRKPLARASDVLGRLPSTSFWAGDLEIVRGTLAHRRLLMDSEIAQLYPGCLTALATYKRSLEQRNALLRAARLEQVPGDAFVPWERQMAESGARIRNQRQGWLHELVAPATRAHGDLAAAETLDLRYAPAGNEFSPSELMEAYGSFRAREVARGASLIGPHRDDFEIEIEGKSAREHASQGQQRTAAIAIKLATWRLAADVLGRVPLLLLDDIFSDLDGTRRARLVEIAANEGKQVFVTCTEPEQAGVTALEAARVFRVKSGRIGAL